MSNQFYSLLVKFIEDYFKEQQFQGSRYYFDTENEDNLEGFIEACRNSAYYIPFEIMNEQRVVYQTLALDFEGRKLIVAPTIDGVTNDFLVMLRNQVSEQASGYENTGILFATASKLDSIFGGSMNIISKNQALSMERFNHYFNESLLHKNFNKIQRKIIQNYVSQHESERLSTYSIFENKTVLSIIEKGIMEADDFKALGYFYVENDHALNDKGIEKLVKENAKLFNKLSDAKEYHNLENVFNGTFLENDQKKVKNLIEEKVEWESLSFNKIAEMMENCRKKAKSKLVVKEELKEGEHTHAYIKQKSDTGAGAREYYIIAESDGEGSVKITFESNLVKNKLQLKRNNPNIKAEITKNELTISFRQTYGFEAEKIEYKHDDKASNHYKFNILVIPSGVGLSSFYRIKDHCRLDIGKTTTKLLIEDLGECILFDESQSEEIILQQKGEVIDLRSVKSIYYGNVVTDGNIDFKLQYYTSEITVIIEGVDRKIYPVSRIEMFNLPRMNKASFEVKDKEPSFQQAKLSTVYNIAERDRKFLRIEKEYIEYAYLHTKNENLDDEALPIDREIKAHYLQFLQIFKEKEQIPSLAYWDEEIIEYAMEYLQAVIQYFNDYQANDAVSHEMIHLALLGVHKEGNDIYLTPFHPITVAYQLQLLEELKDDKVSDEIIKRFSTSGLLPFAAFDKNFKVVEYLTSDDLNLLLWRKYSERNEVTIGNTAQYVSRIVEDKLNQFKKHFSAIFMLNKDYPLRISATNITSDSEFFIGIIKFMLSELKKTNTMPKIELDIYQFNNVESKFEIFSYLNNIDEFLSSFSLDEKVFDNENYDSKDLLRMLQARLNYTKYIIDADYDKFDVDFYHVSFYKMHHNTGRLIINNTKEQPTAMGLKGIINGVSSVETQGNYKVGYGSEFVKVEDSMIYQIANHWNTLHAIIHQGGTAVKYMKDQTLIHNIVLEDNEIWSTFAKKSMWVCFIEPDVDFNYFMNKDSIEVIHYNDQYSSSKKIDAITVTNQIGSYHKLLSGYLNQDEKVIKNVIKAFNVLNGEWLLKIFDDAAKNENTVREKLSVVAASKVHKFILEQRNANIYWIPVSLEEIVRVSGAVGLAKLEIFSTKSLDYNGSLSDDLLFIGIEKTTEITKIHLHGCEVKVGKTQAYVGKAKTQIKNLCNLLYKHLIEDSCAFKKRYLSHFFYELALSNYEKYQAYYNQQYVDIDKVKYDIINENITLDLYEVQGSVICFNSNEDNFVRTLTKMDDLDINIFNYTYLENDILDIISHSNEEIRHDVNSVFDFSVFSNSIELVPFIKHEVEEEFEPQTISISQLFNEPIEEEDEVEGKDEILEVVEEVIEEVVEEKEVIKEVEIETIISPNIEEEHPTLELGVSDHKPPRALHWGYLSKEINNRHVFAIGKSGSGKTYFIQKMLKELAKNKVSSFIIDYSSSFRLDMLDQQFKSDVTINYRLIRQTKCPINPFKRYQQSIDGYEFIESTQDVANRVKHIFSAVYRDLGAVQLNSIYDAVVQGMNAYGTAFNFQRLGEQLKESNPSVLGQIQTFIDSDVFATDVIEWEHVFAKNGEVTIFQLAPYDRMTQRIITEFVLWDFWYYASSKGNENHPMPVILDEAQNLDWSEKGPAYKMLTEGRKFGVCSWYATQSFAQLGKFGSTIIENAATKVYFSVSDSEISDVAKKISKTDYRVYEMKLKELLKGQAIIDTLFEDRDSNQNAIRFVKITKI